MDQMSWKSQISHSCARLSRLHVLALLVTVMAQFLAACCSSECTGIDTPFEEPGICLTSIIRVPVIPDTSTGVELWADIFQEGAIDGAMSLQWRVWRDDIEIDGYESLDPRTIRIDTTERPGVYRVQLAGSIGSVVCSSASEEFDVRRAGAGTDWFRLRVVSLERPDIPPQDTLVEIVGGGRGSLPEWLLRIGVPVQGTLIDDTSGAGIPAYLQFTSEFGPVIESYADAAGGFSGVFDAASLYDVLVIPTDGDRAPAHWSALAAAQLDDLVWTPGEEFTGTVLSPAGLPVAGARVWGRVDEVPTTAATTAGDGTFRLRGRPGAAVALSIAPPADSGLPTLELPATAGLAPDGDIEVRYDGALTSRPFDLLVVDTDGSTPLSGARLTMTSELLVGAATVTIGGQTALVEGRARVSALADASGSLAFAAVPEASYDAVIATEGPGARVSLVTVDLTPGQASPASSSLTPAATIVGSVRNAVEPEGPAIEGVQVALRPLDLLANTPAGTSGLSDQDGFALSVTASGAYELTVTRAPSGLAPLVQTIAAPMPGEELDLGPLLLSPSIEISGQLAVPFNTGALGTYALTLMCHECSDEQAARPVASTVSELDGSFSLTIPDIPGSMTAGPSRPAANRWAQRATEPR